MNNPDETTTYQLANSDIQCNECTRRLRGLAKLWGATSFPFIKLLIEITIGPPPVSAEAVMGGLITTQGATLMMYSNPSGYAYRGK